MKTNDSPVQDKSEGRKLGCFAKQFVLFVTIFVINSLSGSLVHGQNNQASTTILEGLWVYADDFNNRRNLISDMRVLVFQGDRFLDTTVLIGDNYIAVNRNAPDSGTFRVDVRNNRLILTDPFGASSSLQYILNIIPASEGRTYLQLKTANGNILTYYAYTPAAVFNSRAELTRALFKDTLDDLEQINRGTGTGTTRDPEFQRQYEEAVREHDNQMQGLPPGLVLPGGQTVEERARSGPVHGK